MYSVSCQPTKGPDQAQSAEGFETIKAAHDWAVDYLRQASCKGGNYQIQDAEGIEVKTGRVYLNHEQTTSIEA